MPWPNGMPKYDIHRHFAGSIPVETVAKILTGHGINKPIEELTDLMTCRRGDRTFLTFLSKFDVLNSIAWSEDDIITAINAVVTGLVADDIDHCELSVGVDKYLGGHQRWTRGECIGFIRDGFDDALLQQRLTVDLLLQVRMTAPPEIQQANLRLIGTRAVHDLVGVDLVGDESHCDAGSYARYCQAWRQSGKLVLVHAGELGDAGNVRAAIANLKAHRIRHGSAVVHDHDLLALANDHDVCFDVSLHSNWLAGTVPDMRKHHLPLLLAHGCAVTLGTDDPVQFGCNLADEYALGQQLGLFGSSAIDLIRRTAIARSAHGRPQPAKIYDGDRGDR